MNKNLKILIQNDSPAAHFHHRTAIQITLQACGYNAVIWNSWMGKSCFDTFDEFSPDIFWGQSYNLTNGLIQCILERPHLDVILRLSDYGAISDTIDLNYYKILVAKQEEVDKVKELQEAGNFKFGDNHYSQHRLNKTHSHWIENDVKVVSNCFAYDIFRYEPFEIRGEFATDLMFISSSHPYKELSITPYIRPLLYPSGKYNIKIYSTWNWGGTPAFVGQIPLEFNRIAVSSSKICINCSEPHQNNEEWGGYDLPERVFYCAGLGQLFISDYVKSMIEDFYVKDEVIVCHSPGGFHDKIDYCLKHLGTFDEVDIELQQKKKLARQTTLSKHTYFERIANLFINLDMEEDAKHVMDTKKKVFHQMGLEKYLTD